MVRLNEDKDLRRDYKIASPTSQSTPRYATLRSTHDCVVVRSCSFSRWRWVAVAAACSVAAAVLCGRSLSPTLCVAVPASFYLGTSCNNLPY